MIPYSTILSISGLSCFSSNCLASSAALPCIRASALRKLLSVLSSLFFSFSMAVCKFCSGLYLSANLNLKCSNSLFTPFSAWKKLSTPARMSSSCVSFLNKASSKVPSISCALPFSLKASCSLVPKTFTAFSNWLTFSSTVDISVLSNPLVRSVSKSILRSSSLCFSSFSSFFLSCTFK